MHRVLKRDPGTEDVGLPGGIKLDGWEVVAGIGIVCIIVSVLVDDLGWLLWVGIGLIALWLIVVILVLVGVIKPRPAESSEQSA